MDILLIRLKFSSVAVQQSSVCALYSTGYSTACVVDVGDHVTAISCVEDGVSNPNTRLLLSRGGNDVTRAFWWLLREAGVTILSPFKMLLVLADSKYRIPL